MIPHLSPSWSIHASGEQTSAGAIAGLSPQSVNIVSIVRTGVGVYDIALGTPLAPADSILLVPSPWVPGGLFAFPVAARDTNTVRGVDTFTGALAAADAIFKFIIIRFGTP